MSDENEPAAEPKPPVLKVLTPDATPEQVAAVVAVFSGMSGGEDEQPRRRSEWAAPARRMRRPLHPAPGGWRASAFPR